MPMPHAHVIVNYLFDSFNNVLIDRSGNGNDGQLHDTKFSADYPDHQCVYNNIIRKGVTTCNVIMCTLNLRHRRSRHPCRLVIPTASRPLARSHPPYSRFISDAAAKKSDDILIVAAIPRCVPLACCTARMREAFRLYSRANLLTPSKTSLQVIIATVMHRQV